MSDQKVMADILEIVTFLKENSVSKDEFNELKADVRLIQSDVYTLRSDVHQLKSDVKNLKTDVTELQSDMRTVKSTMVTKAYLDDKLADLRGDMILLFRKSDTKLKTMAGMLLKKDILSPKEMKEINSLEPFPV